MQKTNHIGWPVITSNNYLSVWRLLSKLKNSMHILLCITWFLPFSVTHWSYCNLPVETVYCVLIIPWVAAWTVSKWWKFSCFQLLSELWSRTKRFDQWYCSLSGKARVQRSSSGELLENTTVCEGKSMVCSIVLFDESCKGFKYTQPLVGISYFLAVYTSWRWHVHTIIKSILTIYPELGKFQ